MTEIRDDVNRKTTSVQFFNDSHSTIASLKALKATLSDIDEAIYNKVTTTHGELLFHALEVDDLHNLLAGVNQSLKILQKNNDNLKAFVRDNKKKINTEYTRLKNLLSVRSCIVDYFNLVNLRQKLCETDCDLLKVADLFVDVEDKIKNQLYSKIHLFSEHYKVIISFEEKIVHNLVNTIKSSLSIMDVTKLSYALFVSHKLERLKYTFEIVLKELFNNFIEQTSKLSVNSLNLEARKSVMNETFKMTSKSNKTALSISVSQIAFNSVFWKDLDECISFLETFAQNLNTLLSSLNYKHVCLDNNFKRIIPQQWINPQLLGNALQGYSLAYLIACTFDEKAFTQGSPLVIVLASLDFFRKDQQATEVLYSQDLCTLRKTITESENFLEWNLNILQHTLLDSSNKSAQVKQALEGEYPRLVKLVSNLLANLQLSDGALNKSLTSKFAQFLHPFETAYLSRSLARMHDKINLTFSTEHKLPSQVEIEEIVDRACSELSFASTNDDLLIKVTRNLGKTMVFFAEKVETLFDHYKDHTVSSTDKVQQGRISKNNNAKLIYILCIFINSVHDQMSRRIGNISSQELLKLQNTLNEVAKEKIVSLCQEILYPHFYQITREALKIISHVNDENRDICNELRIYFVHITKEVIEPYITHYWKPDLSSPTSMLVLKTLASACICPLVDGFLFNVSLCSNEKRLSFIPSCVNFELTIEPLLTGFSSSFHELASFKTLCPDHFTKIRNFRALIAAESIEEICQVFGINLSPDKVYETRTEIKDLEGSLVLQHLFHRAENELMKPQEFLNCTLEQYMIWWLKPNTTEIDKLKMFQNTLKQYLEKALESNLKEYPISYVGLQKLCDKFIQNFQMKSAQSSKIWN